MVEERITETEGPSGQTHTHTTVVSDGGRGGATWLIVLLVIVLAGLAIWFFSGVSGSETAKNNAIAGAAKDVGQAANKVGDAAQEAADKVGR
jgi:hypothetical protein